MDKKNILIVDDEKDILFVLKKRLTSMGYSVTAVSNSQEALDVALANPPDLAILDVLMPGMDGGQVAQKFQENERTRHIPVIFVTGMFPKRQDDESGRIVDGKIMFSKPFNLEALFSEIHRLLKENEHLSQKVN